MPLLDFVLVISLIVDFLEKLEWQQNVLLSVNVTFTQVLADEAILKAPGFLCFFSILTISQITDFGASCIHAIEGSPK